MTWRQTIRLLVRWPSKMAIAAIAVRPIEAVADSAWAAESLESKRPRDRLDRSSMARKSQPTQPMTTYIRCG